MCVCVRVCMCEDVSSIESIPIKLIEQLLR